jgi:hypothetical protein
MDHVLCDGGFLWTFLGEYVPGGLRNGRVVSRKIPRQLVAGIQCCSGNSPWWLVIHTATANSNELPRFPLPGHRTPRETGNKVPLAT